MRLDFGVQELALAFMKKSISLKVKFDKLMLSGNSLNKGIRNV